MASLRTHFRHLSWVAMVLFVFVLRWQWSTRSMPKTRQQLSHTPPHVGPAHIQLQDVVSGPSDTSTINLVKEPKCTIMFLFNGNPPQFLHRTLSQVRCFNPASECDLWLITNKTHGENFKSQHESKPGLELDLKLGALEDLELTDDYWRFFHNTPLWPQGRFWVFATTRLFFIEAALRKYDLKNVIYIESDIMVYMEFHKYLKDFMDLFPRIGITPVSIKQFTLSVTYIRDSHAMKIFNDFQVANFSTARGGWEPGDMEQLAQYYLSHGPEYLDRLMILPYGETHDQRQVDRFGNVVFDGASYGQYFGGTANGKPPGYSAKHHFVGPELKKGCCTMSWSTDEKGRAIPLLHWKDINSDSDTFGTTGTSQIMDLHIHSKKDIYTQNSCEAQPSVLEPWPDEPFDKALA